MGGRIIQCKNKRVCASKWRLEGLAAKQRTDASNSKHKQKSDAMIKCGGEERGGEVGTRMSQRIEAREFVLTIERG